MRHKVCWAVMMAYCLTIRVATAQDTCWQQTKSEAVTDLKRIPGALGSIPAGLAHSDYRWVGPAGLATGLLAGTGADQSASRQVTSHSLEHTSSVLSNVGLFGIEIGGAGAAYFVGCHEGANSHLRRAGFHTIEAMGYGTVANEVLKVAFGRERPDKAGGDGRFWHGGTSFPSGHAVASWAFAGAMAHEYPDKKWLKYGSYSLAAVVSGLRFSAKRHFPSDLIAGGVIGYATGRHFGE
jgi:membrane-associated phospholipid phosphatase